MKPRTWVCQYPRENHEVGSPCEKYHPAHKGPGFPPMNDYLYLCPFHEELAAQRWGRRSPLVQLRQRGGGRVAAGR